MSGKLVIGGSSDQRAKLMREHAADERVHSDDAHLHNGMPMRPTQQPPDANAEETYLGEGEDRDDDDDDEVD